MSINYGPKPTPPLPDLSYSDAEARLIEDVKRLGCHHRIEGWGILGNGKRFLVCSCNRQARTDDLFWKHIEDDLARERGPEKR